MVNAGGIGVEEAKVGNEVIAGATCGAGVATLAQPVTTIIRKRNRKICLQVFIVFILPSVYFTPRPEKELGDFGNLRALHSISLSSYNTTLSFSMFVLRRGLRPSSVTRSTSHPNFFFNSCSSFMNSNSPRAGLFPDGFSATSKSISLSVVSSPRANEPNTEIRLAYGSNKGVTFALNSAKRSMALV